MQFEFRPLYSTNFIENFRSIFERRGAHVYAPWSVLKFLDAPNLGFSNYWMKSGGTLTLLEKYLHSHALKSPTEYDEEQAVSSDELYQPEHFVVIIRPLDVVIGLDVPTPTKSALAPPQFSFFFSQILSLSGILRGF